jgi:hypothetical protein
VSPSSVVGPAIGGALARPGDSWPSVFAPGSLWDRFPYLLPNLFSAACVSVGVTIGLLFLEETHPKRKQSRDRGRELGDCLLSCLPGGSTMASGRSREQVAEEQPLLSGAEETSTAYLGVGGSAGLSSTARTSAQVPRSLGQGHSGGGSNEESRPVASIFNKPVLTLIASYGILAL